jgi:hypothetical protein
MMPDHRLPESEDELRDWIVLAWEAGWKTRTRLVGRPGGTINAEHKTRQAAYLASLDLPPVIEPAPVPIREAIMRMAAMEDRANPDTGQPWQEDDAHGATCAQRIVGAAECTCGKADALAAREDE